MKGKFAEEYFEELGRQKRKRGKTYIRIFPTDNNKYEMWNFLKILEVACNG